MFASISDQLINTAIILDMMFNTEMIVKVLKGGKEDMTKKVIETVNGWYMENPKQKVELDDIVGLVKIDGPTDSVQLQKEAQLSICEKRIIELKKENEQLKSTIKEVIELLSEEVDLFTNKATEHDINAYIELKELDNKDAFYMAIATKKAIKMLKELQE